jgi:Leucine-rich repeat (LRR) protein
MNKNKIHLTLAHSIAIRPSPIAIPIMNPIDVDEKKVASSSTVRGETVHSPVVTTDDSPGEQQGLKDLHLLHDDVAHKKSEKAEKANIHPSGAAVRPEAVAVQAQGDTATLSPQSESGGDATPVVASSLAIAIANPGGTLRATKDKRGVASVEENLTSSAESPSILLSKAAIARMGHPGIAARPGAYAAQGKEDAAASLPAKSESGGDVTPVVASSFLASKTDIVNRGGALRGAPNSPDVASVEENPVTSSASGSVMTSMAAIARTGHPDIAVQPGAYAVQGTGDTGTSLPPQSESGRDESDRFMARDESLVNIYAGELVLNEPIDDIERQHIIKRAQLAVKADAHQQMMATSVAAEVVDTSESEDTQGKKRWYIIALLALIVIVGAVVGGVMGGRTASSPTNAAPIAALSASSAPSAAPSAFAIERFQREILPEYSQVAIQDTTSPQSKSLNWLANNTELDSYENFKRLQRFALATFYYATGGGNWMVSNDWLSDNDECGWGPINSIACIEGRSSRHEFLNNNLVGTLPDELGILTELETLYLYDNELTGQIPSSLGLLTKLSGLSMYGNQLNGTIPIELSTCTDMTLLYLDDNALTGQIPSALGLLTKLSGLALSRNQLDGTIPSELSGCTDTTEFYLYENALTGQIPSALGLLTKLSRFFLYSNQLNGSIPSELSACTSLGELALSFNELTGQIPSALGLLTKLSTFGLAGNQLDGSIPSELSACTDMTKIYLWDNALSGQIPSPLGLLTKLSRLWLYSNQLEGTIPIELSACTDMTSLYLYDNALTGQIPSALGLLSRLEHLWLFNNTLSGSVPVELCNLVESNGLDLRIDCTLVECDCGCSCVNSGRVVI